MINPGANISGGVVIGEGVLIGTGAQVLQYLHIGSGRHCGCWSCSYAQCSGAIYGYGNPSAATRRGAVRRVRDIVSSSIQSDSSLTTHYDNCSGSAKDRALVGAPVFAVFALAPFCRR